MLVNPQVIWKRLYRCSLACDGGTLYQLRNLINRRNVTQKPKDAAAPCEEFFSLVTEAHILCAAMTTFGMQSVTDNPATSDLFPHGCADLPPDKRRNILILAARKIVDSYTDMETPFFPCTVDGTSTTSKAKSDKLQAYSCETLTLGLLLAEFVDAIHEGDGSRIIRCWRFFLPLFKATNRVNYSIEAFTLLCQHHFFSDRMKKQLEWSRTVNVHGKPGKNIPMDLHMEHLNRHCKTMIKGLGANVTEHAISRVGKCLGELVKATTNFDVQTGVSQESMHHTCRTDNQDLCKMVAQLQKSEVFSEKAGRKHGSFPKFEQNVMKKIDVDAFKLWMQQQYQKLLTYD